MSTQDFDFDTALRSLIELVEENVKKIIDDTEHHFEWINNFPVKARQRLEGSTAVFKMPKTPARKKTRNQKKRVLALDGENEVDSDNIPSKKGRLSHDNDDEIIGGRPRRQASNAAKSKIQHSLKMMNLHQKLRRPSGEEEVLNVTSHETEDKRKPFADITEGNEIESNLGVVIRTTVAISKKTEDGDLFQVSSSCSIIEEEDAKPVESTRVNFASQLQTEIPEVPKVPDIPEVSEVAVRVIDETFTAEATEVVPPVEPPNQLPAQPEPVKKGRTTRKGKKVEEIPVQEIVEEEPKKKVKKVRKPVAAEEKVVASPRVTRHRGFEAVAATTVINSPCKTPTRSKIPEVASKNMKFQSPSSSPMRKALYTPKLVFSPYKPSSVKTKVQAFEAVFNGEQGLSVLPEARVLLKRLTDQEILDASARTSSQETKSKEMTSEKRGTFVMTNTPGSPALKDSDRRSVANALARKSIDKAKHMALTAARNKFLNSAIHNETAESPNVHVNQNAASILSKYLYRFTNPSSSGSSIRHVAMTKVSNIVTNVSSFTSSKPMVPMVTKASEEEEIKRKELELRRLKEKEEEAARKREEMMRAKAEEHKKKHEARAKRAMEQRALRAKQAGQEQKLKLEHKEEKCNNLKMKLIAESQEKAEKIRAGLLQRQQEAEQRRKAEELQKREMEEEQQRLALIKKEQEEQERIAKQKLEIEKAKAVPPPAPKLNTTVTLQSNATNSYQITPVRVTKAGKLVNPDNYDINDMRSDDSTDDDARPKKTIPDWARSALLRVALAEQTNAKVDLSDQIFPKEILLQDPNLNKIFKIKRPRFDKRTSSAVWKTPPSHYL